MKARFQHRDQPCFRDLCSRAYDLPLRHFVHRVDVIQTLHSILVTLMHRVHRTKPGLWIGFTPLPDRYLRGLERAEAQIARDPRNGYMRSFLGYFAASLGDRQRAESEIAQALRLSAEDADTRWTARCPFELRGVRQRLRH